MNIKLVKLMPQYQRHLVDMMSEWVATGEKIVPYAIRKNDYTNFDYYLANLEIKQEIDRLVPDTTLFCLDVSSVISPVLAYTLWVQFLMTTFNKSMPM